MPGGHPLKNFWKLMFLPSIDKTQTTLYGDYDKAYKALLKVVGELSTVEAVCSAFNSLPIISAFPPKDFIILCRDGKEPKYESFANDARKIVIDTITDESTKIVLELLLASVLGDSLEREIGENPCHVLRMSHRPGFKTALAVRFEIWMDSPSDRSRLRSYFEDLLGGYSVEESQLK